jgi:hypothetical protein
LNESGDAGALVEPHIALNDFPPPTPSPHSVDTMPAIDDSLIDSQRNDVLQLLNEFQYPVLFTENTG